MGSSSQRRMMPTKARKELGRAEASLCFFPSVCLKDVKTLQTYKREPKARASLSGHVSLSEPGHHAPQESSRQGRPPETTRPRNVGRECALHGRTRKLDIHLSLLMIASALGRSAHLTEDVDLASIQREAIKIIKGTKSMSCKEGWRNGTRIEGSSATW